MDGYSHCPGCGVEGTTAGFSHLRGCTWNQVPDGVKKGTDDSTPFIGDWAAKRIEELEEALCPFAECDAHRLGRAIPPEDQYVYMPQSSLREMKGISLAHIMKARRVLGLPEEGGQ